MQSKYLIITVGLLSIVVGSMNVVYGASSLNELQGEVTGAQTYRQDLIKFALDHNMSIYNEDFGGLGGIKGHPLNTWVPFTLQDLQTWDLGTLERTVKTHMQLCETAGNQSVTSILSVKGDC